MSWDTLCLLDRVWSRRTSFQAYKLCKCSRYHNVMEVRLLGTRQQPSPKRHVSSARMANTSCVTVQIYNKPRVSRIVLFYFSSHCVFLSFVAGSVQRPHAQKYLTMQACRFRPQHKNKLGNEFSLFTNYNPKERLGGWSTDEDEVEQVSWSPLHNFLESQHILLLPVPCVKANMGHQEIIEEFPCCFGLKAIPKTRFHPCRQGHF